MLHLMVKKLCDFQVLKICTRTWRVFAEPVTFVCVCVCVCVLYVPMLVCVCEWVCMCMDVHSMVKRFAYHV